MEIEAKYRISNPELYDILSSTDSLAGFAIEDVKIKKVEDQYFDSEDLVFMRGGFSLRLRSSGGSKVVTLKSLDRGEGALYSRQEVETTLEPGTGMQIANWPEGPARELAGRLAGGRPLEALFRIRQQRVVRNLCRISGGQAVIELSLDQVELQAASGLGQTGENSFLELEAELLPGGRLEELEAVVEFLEEVPGLVAESRSKFEQGLALARPDIDLALVSPARDGESPALAPDPLPGVDRHDPVAEAIRKVLRVQFEVMLANEGGSRQVDGIEAVHDMRVATRRMRSALRLYGSYFDPEVVTRFKKDLRKIGRALGRVRDLDVFEREMQRYLATVPEGQAGDLAPLREVWSVRREVARGKLNRFLDGKRYRRFARVFGHFVSTEGAGVRPGTAESPDRDQVRFRLHSHLWQLYEGVWAYQPIVADATVSQLHALRIDCKRLRYSLEFFQEVLGPEAEGLIKDVIAIQDHLGDIQDAVVAEGMMESMLGKSDHLADENVIAYRDFRRAEAQQLVETFPRAWPMVGGSEFRRRLAGALMVPIS
ncbi:MAG: CHAD domain-containing protein [Chloroflexota bacterium]|nr:CHAD domain-containing protein [Chloroflexota bacterium]